MYNPYPMNRYFVTILIISLFLGFSCTSRKNIAEHKDLIPEKDLTSILTESYLADGILVLPAVKYKFIKGDTLSTYIDIIESYGYTKAEMDRTMRYYFVRKPKKLIKIYDKVLGQLSEEESRIDQKLPEFNLSEINLWPGKSFYSIPDINGEDTAWIDFDFIHAGKMYLKFTVTIYPDDQSPEPSLGMYISSADSTGNEIWIPLAETRFLKDGHPHTYNITLYLPPKQPARLRGWFIDNEGASPDVEKHHRVENIILSRQLIE
jgi:hypothetical protein